MPDRVVMVLDAEFPVHVPVEGIKVEVEDPDEMRGSVGGSVRGSEDRQILTGRVQRTVGGSVT